MPESTTKPGPDNAPGLPHGETLRAKSEPPRKRTWIILIIVVIAFAGFLYYQHQAAEQGEKVKADTASKPISVVTAAATQGPMGIYVEALGTVTPVYTVTVTSRVQGQIMEVSYQEGQMVRKGDPLLEIDPRPYEAALTQAQGQLALHCSARRGPHRPRPL